jgi:hypothetical protein
MKKNVWEDGQGGRERREEKENDKERGIESIKNRGRKMCGKMGKEAEKEEKRRKMPKKEE